MEEALIGRTFDLLNLFGSMEEAMIVTSVFVASTNAAVICMVIFIKELRTFTNYFVLSLAVSDMFNGCILLPTNHLTFSRVPSKVIGSLTCFVFLAGVWNLCAVTWDRYVAVVYVFRYKHKVKKHLKKIIFSIWTLAVVVSLIPLSWGMDPERLEHKCYIVVMLVAFVFVPYVFIIVAYVRIWLRLRSHAAEMKRMDMTNEQREGARRASLEGKTVKVFLVVVSVFLVSWLPVIYMTVVSVVLDRPDLEPRDLPLISLFTIAGSSLVNPMLYAFMKKDFTAQFQLLRIVRAVNQSAMAANATSTSNV